MDTKVIALKSYKDSGKMIRKGDKYYTNKSRAGELVKIGLAKVIEKSTKAIYETKVVKPENKVVMPEKKIVLPKKEEITDEEVDESFLLEPDPEDTQEEEEKEVTIQGVKCEPVEAVQEVEEETEVIDEIEPEDEPEEVEEVSEPDFNLSDYPKHVGAGYYIMPDGSKIRGKKKAKKAMQSFIDEA